MLIPSEDKSADILDDMRNLMQLEDTTTDRMQNGFIQLYDRCYYQMWFEEGSEVEKIVKSHSVDDAALAIDELRREIVEPNKKKWMEKFKLMSILLYLAKSNAGRKWQEFFYVFERMHDDSCPKVQKIMRAISRRSHQQMIERMNQ
jgi:hypothetical protein